MDLLPLHINMDTWHLCEMFVTVNRTLLLQLTERKMSEIDQFNKNKQNDATNKWARMSVVVRPANFRYDWKKQKAKGTPITAGSDRLSSLKGDCSLHFHHRPRGKKTNFIQTNLFFLTTHILKKNSLEQRSPMSLWCVSELNFTWKMDFQAKCGTRNIDHYNTTFCSLQRPESDLI